MQVQAGFVRKLSSDIVTVYSNHYYATVWFLSNFSIVLYLFKPVCCRNRMLTTLVSRSTACECCSGDQVMLKHFTGQEWPHWNWEMHKLPNSTSPRPAGSSLMVRSGELSHYEMDLNVYLQLKKKNLGVITRLFPTMPSTSVHSMFS